ncbi:cell wall-binding repeat-containing protein [Kineococcus terrestris]|uniref:cell wall-binding repeat-containing protein n=1 Tax=Kineococcus terrestris TaxID=2044856 RepID=UPI0034DB5557
MEGASRYATAVQASASTFSPAVDRTVLLASGTSTVDALSASYLAGSYDSPVLLTARDTITSETIAELRRLGATRVVIAGGENAVSAEVATLLQESFTVERAAGSDRYDTAAQLTELVADDGAPEVVFVAAGGGAADAAAASPMAAANGWPILLTGRDDVPAPTRDALERWPDAEVVVLGGTAAVSDATARELGAETRLQGGDRYDTAVAVADFATDRGGFSGTGFGLALGSGGDLADALVAGPILARSQAPLLLASSPQSLGAATETYLTDNADRFTGEALVFGGSGAVGQDVVAAAATAADAPVPSPPVTPAPTPVPTPTPPPSTPVDRTAPTLTTAVVDGTALQLTFDEPLLATSTPAPQAFTVSAGPDLQSSQPVQVTGVTVLQSSVSLVLAAPVAYGQVVTIAYDPPQTGSLQDRAANRVAGFSGRLVSNSTPEAAPGAVRNVQVVTSAVSAGQTDGSIRVTWEAPLAAPGSGGVDEYEVTLTRTSPPGAQPTTRTISAAGAREAIFSALAPGQYSADVVARNQDAAAGAVTTSTSLPELPPVELGVAPTSADFTAVADGRLDPGDSVRLTLPAPPVLQDAAAAVYFAANGYETFYSASPGTTITVDGNDLVLTNGGPYIYGGSAFQVRVFRGVTVGGRPVNTWGVDPAVISNSTARAGAAPTNVSVVGGVLSGDAPSTDSLVEVRTATGAYVGGGYVPAGGSFSYDLRNRNLTAGQPLYVVQWNAYNQMPGAAAVTSFTP